MLQPPLFRTFDARLAVLDMPCSTPTTVSSKVDVSMNINKMQTVLPKIVSVGSTLFL